MFSRNNNKSVAARSHQGRQDKDCAVDRSIYQGLWVNELRGTKETVQRGNEGNIYTRVCGTHHRTTPGCPRTYAATWSAREPNGVVPGSGHNEGMCTEQLARIDNVQGQYTTGLCRRVMSNKARTQGWCFRKPEASLHEAKTLLPYALPARTRTGRHWDV